MMHCIDMRFISPYDRYCSVPEKRSKILLVMLLLGSTMYIDTCTFYQPTINTWLFNWSLLFQVKLSKVLLCLPVIVTKHTLALWDQISVSFLSLGSAISPRSSGCWSLCQRRFRWRLSPISMFGNMRNETEVFRLVFCTNFGVSGGLVFCLLEQYVLLQYFDSPSRGHDDRLQQITLILFHLLFYLVMKTG